MKRENIEGYLEKIRKIREEKASVINDFISDVIRKSDFYDVADIKYRNRLEEISGNIDKPGYDKRLMEFAEEFLIEN